MATPETFWTLLRDSAHWEFEIFLMILVDVVILGIFWPFLRKHWQHHVDRDRAIASIMNPKSWTDSTPLKDSSVTWFGTSPTHVQTNPDLWPAQYAWTEDGTFGIVVNGGPNEIRHQGK